MTSTRRWARWVWRVLPATAACGLAAGSMAAGSMAAAPASAAPVHAAATQAVSSAGEGPVQQAEALVAKMTLAQKITELHGLQDSDHQRYVPGIPSLGIPPLVITNGPAGVGPGDDPTQQPATALPAPISLAASFDPALANQYGKVIGKEAADLGNNLVEGPDVNIVRIPEAGRTFESFSEDPLLTADIGTAAIQGIQAQPGMIAEVKHFDAYSQETNRNTPQDDNIVSDRVLHEIYDPPFQQAITKGGSQSLMCSYATVNGEYSCQNPYLLSTTVDQRWGFDGFVQSDFGATHSTVGSAQAGMDLEMPTGDYYAAPLEQAVLDGQVPIASVNQLLVTRFAAMIRQGLFSHPVSTSPIPAQQDGDFSLSAAEQGMVLLKNDDQALPLPASSVKSVAVIGPYAGAAMTGGGGSSHVDPLFTVSPVQGIENVVGPNVPVAYNDGSDISSAVAAARSAQVAIVMVGDDETEGADQPSLDLSGDQDQLVEAVAAANPDTIVVVKSGNPVLMPWLSDVPAVLEAWYPGEEDGSAVAAVLFGKVDPSGKLPVTFPTSNTATPTSSPSQWPGVDGEVTYSEGLDVGYRGYDAEGIAPQFPFGYGLSYTTFAFSDLRTSKAQLQNPVSGPGATSCDCNGQGARLETVTATVTNTGKVAGAEVAQLYLGDPAVASEPSRQLEGFDKVYLKPGQSTTVRFELTGHQLSYWDDTANGWVLPDGAFQVYVGDSSALANLPLQASFTVTRSVGARYATLTTPLATVNPGSAIPVSATFTNDGDYATGPAVPALRVPAGWTATSGSRQPVSLAPGQSVTENWTVSVPVGAQAPTATLTTDLNQAGRAVGNLTTSATVTVNPALTVSASTAVVNASGQGSDTLTVTSNLPGVAVLHYAASPPSGVTIVPAQGNITVPTEGTAATVQVQAASALAPGSYPVRLSLSFTDQGRRYSLAPTQIPVAVPASLSASFDNTAISNDSDPSAANIINGRSYSAQALAAAGVAPGSTVSYGGTSFTWPDVPAGAPDNVEADGQLVAVSGSGTSLAFLGSATGNTITAAGTVFYTDGTSQQFTLTLGNWWGAAGDVVASMPYQNDAVGQYQHVAYVYYASVPIESGKQVLGVQLPVTGTSPAAGMHIFGIAVS